MENRSDEKRKIVILGNAGVGKSALSSRFADDKFSPKYIPTVGDVVKQMHTPS